jgi:hypothetical protein
MNIAQKFMAYVFKWQYVRLIHDYRMNQPDLIRRAYSIDDNWFANPYLPSTRVHLTSTGTVYKGRYIIDSVNYASYIDSWEPITKGMIALYL